MKKVGGLVYVDAKEMKELDRTTIEDYGIDVLSLMENAGTAVAVLCCRLLGDVGGKRIACLAGKGNNGGDGLVAARRLGNWGAEVCVVTPFGKSEMGAMATRQLDPLVTMAVPVRGPDADLKSFDMLIDALLGYSSTGSPRDPIAGLIRRANGSGVRIVAVDIPSGLDPNDGTPGDPCIVAEATITLALPKLGFLNSLSKKHVGDLYLGDVSIPQAVYRGLGQDVTPFGRDQVCKLS
jgi:NAD(P)H-hydrate epimerase